MKTIQRTTLLLAAAAAIAAWPATPLLAQTNRNDREAEAALQAAINREVVDGELQAAIEQYTKLVEKHPNSRAVAAKALYHLGQAHEKLGNAEARKAYERITRDFADQKDVAANAGRRLAGLNGPSASGRPSASLVWKGHKVDLTGSVSRDGHYLSFIDWDTGSLALRDLATGQDRKVVPAPNKPNQKFEAFAEESAISRDGRQVAYSWFDKKTNRYDLRIANLSGDATPRRLYDDSTVSWLEPRDWSPDGKWIAVLIALKDRTDQLGLVSVADGSLRVLRTGEWSGNTSIFFSPDGKYLGYDLPQGDARKRDVWITAADGTGDRAAVLHPGDDRMLGWSPDGKQLLFRSDRTGAMALWSLPVSDGKPHGLPAMIKADVGEAESLGVTDSGAMLYGVRPGRGRRGSIQIGSFDFRSGAVTSPQEVSDDYLEDNTSPCWSPDGKYLAYVSERQHGRMMIVIRSTDTRRVVRELPYKLRDLGLSEWAPDNRALLAAGQDIEGRTGAFRIDVETGEITVLFEGSAAVQEGRVTIPVSSPDGRSIYYRRSFAGDAGTVFLRRDIASGVEHEIIRRPVLWGLNLSPDGNYAATESIDPAKNERIILLIPLHGGEPRVLMRIASGVALADLNDIARRGARVVPACWAPDSRSFIARKQARTAAESELWQVPVDGGSPRKLDSMLEGNIFKLTLSPDGKKVAFRKQEPTAPAEGKGKEVWVLENFLPAEK